MRRNFTNENLNQSYIFKAICSENDLQNNSLNKCEKKGAGNLQWGEFG